jgi:hypothetical protein
MLDNLFCFSEYWARHSGGLKQSRLNGALTMGKARVRRRAPKTGTARMKAVAACAAHLRDLKRAHRRPPPDAEAAPEPTLRRLSPAPQSSYCTSPAELCAEFAK